MSASRVRDLSRPVIAEKRLLSPACFLSMPFIIFFSAFSFFSNAFAHRLKSRFGVSQQFQMHDGRTMIFFFFLRIRVFSFHAPLLLRFQDFQEQTLQFAIRVSKYFLAIFSHIQAGEKV
jgi:hypothetical protein